MNMLEALVWELVAKAVTLSTVDFGLLRGKKRPMS